jgi:hypothetical protein
MATVSLVVAIASATMATICLGVCTGAHSMGIGALST